MFNENPNMIYMMPPAVLLAVLLIAMTTYRYLRRREREQAWLQRYGEVPDKHCLVHTPRGCELQKIYPHEAN